MLKNLIKSAWRNLLRNKTHTAVNVLGLIIGIIVCLLIGIWLERELSFDNFHPNANSIFRISNTFKSESESFSQAPSGPALGARLPQLLPEIKTSCRIFRFGYKVKVANKEFFELQAPIVDSNFFTFFGFPLKQGEPAKVLQAPDQVVLTENLAIKYFGHEDPIGKTIMLDDTLPMIVSGIAENPPINSHIQFDLLIPFSYFHSWALSHWKEDVNDVWVGGWPTIFVDLNNPRTWSETEKQINKIVAKYSEKEWKENKMSYHYFLQPIRDIHLKSHLRYDAGNNGSLSQVNIFSIVGIIVLLLACINYINLTTAGALKRAKETSVRKVIGATRTQLTRQFLFETIALSAISVIFALILVKLILVPLSAWIGQPYEFPLNLTSMAILVSIIVFTSTVAGVYPAILLSSFNPAIALKGNFSRSVKGNLIRKGLVLLQFTITIALIASIIIINQQMRFIKNKSLGFNGNAVVEVNFYGDPIVGDHFLTIRNELLKSPYIHSVSKHQVNIVGGMGNGWTTTENLKGDEISTSIYRMNVDDEYFKTYDMKLAAGRFFSKDIPSDSTKAVLVNEAAVRTFGWQTPQNAIGKKFGKGEQTRQVIGVVKDFNFENLHKSVEAVLIGFAREGGLISFKMDADHIDAGIDHLKKTWEQVAPHVPLQYSFVDERIAQQYGSEQKMQGIFYGFSGLSLLIACLGLFGLTTFVIERKVKEIGIRKVLGASVSGIVQLLSKDFLQLIMISILIATPIAWYFMNGWLADFAYRVSISWWVFLIAGAAAVLIALLTVSVQAIKAAMANPVKSLRTE
jgi:putative ABC transport system permease protein